MGKRGKKRRKQAAASALAAASLQPLPKKARQGPAVGGFFDVYGPKVRPLLLDTCCRSALLTHMYEQFANTLRRSLGGACTSALLTRSTPAA